MPQHFETPFGANASYNSGCALDANELNLLIVHMDRVLAQDAEGSRGSGVEQGPNIIKHLHPDTPPPLR